VVVNALFGSGLIHWLPAFLGRSHALSSTQIGTALAVALGVSGLGAYAGGALASRYAPNDEPRQLRGVAVAILVASIVLMLSYVSPNATWAVVLMTLFMFGLQTCNGPILGAVQTLVPERMRAVSFALIYLFANLVGAGLGPLATGALSDALQPWAGDESLRYALLILTPGFAWSAWHVSRASKTVTHDILSAQGRDNRQAEQTGDAELETFARRSAAG
jgi:MFS family permease